MPQRDLQFRKAELPKLLVPVEKQKLFTGINYCQFFLHDSELTESLPFCTVGQRLWHWAMHLLLPSKTAQTAHGFLSIILHPPHQKGHLFVAPPPELGFSHWSLSFPSPHKTTLLFTIWKQLEKAAWLGTIAVYQRHERAFESWEPGLFSIGRRKASFDTCILSTSSREGAEGVKFCYLLGGDTVVVVGCKNMHVSWLKGQIITGEF